MRMGKVVATVCVNAGTSPRVGPPIRQGSSGAGFGGRRERPLLHVLQLRKAGLPPGPNSLLQTSGNGRMGPWALDKITDKRGARFR